MKLNFPFGKKSGETPTKTAPKGRFENIFSPNKERPHNDNPTVDAPDDHVHVSASSKATIQGRLKSITEFTSNLGKNISEMLDLPEPTVNHQVHKNKDGTVVDEPVDIFSANLFDVVKCLGNDVTKEARKLIPSKLDKQVPKKATAVVPPNEVTYTGSSPSTKSPSGRVRRASDFLEMENIYTFEEFDVDTPSATRKAAAESRRQREEDAAILAQQQESDGFYDDDNDDDEDRDVDTTFEIKSSLHTVESPICHPKYGGNPSDNHHLVQHVMNLDDSVLEDSNVNEGEGSESEEEDEEEEEEEDEEEDEEEENEETEPAHHVPQTLESHHAHKKHHNNNQRTHSESEDSYHKVSSPSKNNTHHQHSSEKKLEVTQHQQHISSNDGFDDFDDDEFCV